MNSSRDTMAMWNEIREQPAMLRERAVSWTERARHIRAEAPSRATPVVLGRGSSGHACTFATYLIALETGRHPVELRPWITTQETPRADWSDSIAYAYSASGASTDVSAAARWLRDRGAHVVAVTNAQAGPSVLEEASHQSFRVAAGPERAVPATKSFCAQLFAAAALTGLDVTTPASDSARVMDEILKGDLGAELAEFLANARQVVWLARGPALAAALDGALKAQEAAGRLTLAYSTAEFLHGPVASVGPEDRVIILDDGVGSSENTEAVVASLVARRTPVVTVGPDSSHAALRVPMPDASWARVPVLGMLTQWVALELALRLGLDPDAPAGLKKVTLT